MSNDPLIYPRSSWSPRHDNGDLTLPGLAVAVVIHHSVTHANGDSRAAEEAHMRELEKIGEKRFGTGISYNVLIFPSGRAYQGCSFHRRGTHTGGHNSSTRSICYVGNFENDTPTDAALAKGAAIIEEGRNRWWSFNAPISGHRDYKSTACPGTNLYKHLDVLDEGWVGDDGPVFVDNPVKPTKPSNLAVDGWWGKSTTARLQRVLGTPVDGIVSSQSAYWRDNNPGLTSGWRWVANPIGSKVMLELQDYLELPHGQRDGILGPYSIRRLQRHLGTPDDGWLSKESQAIMALQRRLNDGKV